MPSLFFNHCTLIKTTSWPWLPFERWNTPMSNTVVKTRCAAAKWSLFALLYQHWNWAPVQAWCHTGYKSRRQASAVLLLDVSREPLWDHLYRSNLPGGELRSEAVFLKTQGFPFLLHGRVSRIFIQMNFSNLFCWVNSSFFGNVSEMGFNCLCLEWRSFDGTGLDMEQYIWYGYNICFVLLWYCILEQYHLFFI